MDERHAEAGHQVIPTYVERLTCRSCKQPRLESVIHLGHQYLSNFVREKDESLPRSPLELVRCHDCGLLQLRHSIDGDLMWREYWYRSSINQTMRDALQDVVRDGLHHHHEGVWLDIGANDGYLLSRVTSRFTKIGCEPALNLIPALEEHADKTIADYFTAERALEMADSYEVITSCAMFYDLDDPDRFVGDISQVLSPTGVWINQLSDAPTMLRQNAFDAICHEHLCYYDVPTLKHLYERHGLHIIGISHNDVNGGSVRITASKIYGHGDSPTLGIRPVDAFEVQAFARRIREWKELMHNLLDMPIVRDSDVWGLGASTKGACMLQYLDRSDQIVAIGDRNPAKHGLMMAGTWIPVVDEITMRKALPRTVIPLIWAFEHEILERESALRAGGTRFLMPLPNPKFML